MALSASNSGADKFTEIARGAAEIITSAFEPGQEATKGQARLIDVTLTLAKVLQCPMLCAPAISKDICYKMRPLPLFRAEESCG